MDLRIAISSELITDRTKTDALMGTDKGRYSARDLNRVERAVRYLLVLAPKVDAARDLETKTDWGLPGSFDPQTWPTVGQMERYLGNVACLCAAVGIEADLPASMDQLTWEGANQIEEALLAVYNRIDVILQSFQFSGEFFAGEENGI